MKFFRTELDTLVFTKPTRNTAAAPSTTPTVLFMRASGSRIRSRDRENIPTSIRIPTKASGQTT